MIAHIVAVLAPLINCVQQMPQLYKAYETKSVDDLSLGTLLLILLTNLLWLTHGYFIMDYSLLISGVVSLCINSALLALYLIYRKNVKPVAKGPTYRHDDILSDTNKL